jgi:hypothetical protein
VCASFGVKNGWEADDRKVAEEWVWVRVFKRAGSTRAVDVSLTWQALEEIRLQGAEERGYGGLCLRLARRLDPLIVTPLGRLEKDSDLQQVTWADQSGVFGEDGRRSGVAIFQHPTNPDFPAGWCLRYYGFLGVSWPGLEKYTLRPGEPLTLRFRLWIHEGDADAGLVRQAFEAFVDPPTIRIRSN